MAEAVADVANKSHCDLFNRVMYKSRCAKFDYYAFGFDKHISILTNGENCISSRAPRVSSVTWCRPVRPPGDSQKGAARRQPFRSPTAKRARSAAATVVVTALDVFALTMDARPATVRIATLTGSTLTVGDPWRRHGSCGSALHNPIQHRVRHSGPIELPVRRAGHRSDATTARAELLTTVTRCPVRHQENGSAERGGALR